MDENECQRYLAGNRDMRPERVVVSGCVTGDDDGTVIDSVEVDGSGDGDDEPRLLSSGDVSGVTKAALSRSTETFSERPLMSSVKYLSLLSMTR